MIRKLTHFTQACPVCGRPLRIRNVDSGRLVICQHCRGRFTADGSEQSDDKETKRDSLLVRADRLLAFFTRRLGIQDSRSGPRPRERGTRHYASFDRSDTQGSRIAGTRVGPSRSWEGSNIRYAPTVLLVEPQDDLFYPLSSDLSALGIRIIRAMDAAQAISLYVRRPTDVLIVNADQPNESAWLLAAKLHLTHPTARLWGYKCQSSAHDVAVAKLLNIDELISYQGSPCRLLEEILDRLVRLTEHVQRASEDGDTTDPDQAAA